MFLDYTTELKASGPTGPPPLPLSGPPRQASEKFETEQSVDHKTWYVLFISSFYSRISYYLLQLILPIR
jgi:hypothetical protein